MTLDAFITDTWAPQRAADLKPATRAFYAGLHRAHIAPTFAAVPLREITPQRVAAWQADRVKAGAGRRAVTRALRLFGGILAYAVELEHVQANAARAVRPVRAPAPKTGRALSACEIEALRAELDGPWSMLVALMAYTGVRPGEALALRWGDIGEQTIRVERAVSLCDGSTHGTKTDTARTVRLLAPLAADLAAWRLRSGRPAKTAPVIPHPSGHPWSKTAWGNWRRRHFGTACEAARIGALRPYDLRHTFASLLLAEGRSVHYVAGQLGHSAVMTLRTYGHVIADYRDRQAIDADEEIKTARTMFQRAA